MDKPIPKSASINIAVVGAVDAAKSTLIGVLSNGELDDGDGKARMAVLSQKHEKESGRTSHVNIVNINSTIPPTRIQEAGYITNARLLDLAGHEKYLKTTLHGLTGYFPDYALLVVSLPKGVTRITADHMAICRSLNIPVIIVLSKMDVCPPETAKETLTSVQLLCKQVSIKHFLEIKDAESAARTMEAFNMNPLVCCPYIRISNKTGFNLDLLRDVLFRLPDPSRAVNKTNQSITNYVKESGLNQLFFINKVYFVKGAGLVLYGINKAGPIKKNDKILVGPVGLEYVAVKVRSIHNEFKELVDHLESGQTGCLAIRPVDAKIDLQKNQLRNGRVAIDKPLMFRRIVADIFIFNHSTTIMKGYTPYIHCANVSITARIVDGKEFPLRSQKKSEVTFEFPLPQFVYPGARLLFRDGNIKGIGVVRSIDPADPGDSVKP